MQELESVKKQIESDKKHIADILNAVKLKNVLQKLKQEGRKNITVISLGCGSLSYPEAFAVFEACDEHGLKCDYFAVDNDPKPLGVVAGLNQVLGYAQSAKTAKGHNLWLKLCDASNVFEMNQHFKAETVDLIIVRHPDMLNNYSVFKKILNDVTPVFVKESGHVLLTTYLEEEYKKTLQEVEPYVSNNKTQGPPLKNHPVQSGKNVLQQTTIFYSDQFNCLLQVDPEKRAQHLAKKKANAPTSWCSFFGKVAAVAVVGAAAVTAMTMAVNTP